MHRSPVQGDRRPFSHSQAEGRRGEWPVWSLVAEHASAQRGVGARGACSPTPPCRGHLEPSPGCDGCWSRPLQDSSQASSSASHIIPLWLAAGRGRRACAEIALSCHHGGVGKPGGTQDPVSCQAPLALHAFGQEPTRPRLPSVEAPPLHPRAAPSPTTGAQGVCPCWSPDPRWSLALESHASSRSVVQPTPIPRKLSYRIFMVRFS